MSSIMTGLVWDLPILGEFARPEKYVLLAYADHADQNGRSIYPSVDLIARKSGYDERSVQMITRRLESLGYLVDDGEGPRGTNRWYIPLERTAGGAKISPISPEGISPEGISPELVVVVKESTTTTLRSNIFKLYEQNFGALTPMIADALKDAEATYPAEWIENAMTEAVENNKRNWKYVEAILKRWQVDGPQSKKSGGTRDNSKRTSRTAGKANARTGDPLSPEQRTRAERINAKRKADREQRLSGSA
jgi:DnaD/phage-associated family protein